MDAGAELTKLGDGRNGIGILGDQKVFQIERKADRMKIKGADSDGVALQPAVDRLLHIVPKRLVDKKKSEEKDHKGRQKPDPESP